MTDKQPAKIEGKHALRLYVMLGIGSAINIPTLIYCINGGEPLITLFGVFVGFAFVATGVTWATWGATADAARAATQPGSPASGSTSPKPPEPAQT